MNKYVQEWTILYKSLLWGRKRAQTMAHLRKRIQTAGRAVQRPPGTEELPQIRNAELPGAVAVEILDEPMSLDHAHRKTQAYTTIDVASTKGKMYRITVPASYALNIPKVWSWNERRLKAAELLASGFPVAQVVLDPDVGISSRHVIYAWLQHPEFKEHVDALVLETGFASQRERIAGLTRLTQTLFDRLLLDADRLPLTEKSVGSIITGVLAGMKQLAQEKGEFIEMQNVQQQTQLSGTLATAQIDVTEALKSKSEAERRELEDEFDKMGDDIIRQITGAK